MANFRIGLEINKVYVVLNGHNIIIMIMIYNGMGPLSFSIE